MCRDELLDLVEIVVVRLAGGAAAITAGTVDVGIDATESCNADDVEAFEGATCPTYLSVRMKGKKKSLFTIKLI